MTVYEKYAIEEDEDILIGSLANINKSIKSKDKSLFLENISNFMQKNIRDYNDKSVQKIEEIKRRQTIFKSELHNKNYSNSDQKQQQTIDDSIKFTRSFSFESIQNIDVNFNDLGKKNDILSINSKCSTLTSNVLVRSPVELFINDPILSQNILQAQATLKLFIIGDEKVGKSLFVNKFLHKEINNYDYYEHTDSLAISKNLIYLVNKSVKLEIYDTNKVILDSQLFKSNFGFSFLFILIQIFYKLNKLKFTFLAFVNLCDCFILIFDPTERNSILFLEEKLKEIKRNYVNPDVLIIGNIRFIDLNEDSAMFEKNKKFKVIFFLTN